MSKIHISPFIFLAMILLGTAIPGQATAQEESTQEETARQETTTQTTVRRSTARTAMPAVMDSASISDQMTYLQDRTRIYNGFRAIRNDIFLRMKSNVLDSLGSAKSEIQRLKGDLNEREGRIESLNADLDKTRNDRDQAIRTKDSFAILGLQLNKVLYNTIMWIIVVSLVTLCVILFLIYKRTRAVTLQTRKDLTATMEEFETYRKSSREKYEKLVVSHHNEIMRLKRS